MFLDGLLVDPVIIDFESFTFDHLPEGLEIEPEISYSPTYFSPLECTPSLDTIDRPSGVLHVWFLLLEGMHSAAISANSTFQPYILNLLYSDLLQLMDNPG